jgi:hypothetical protein
MKMSNAATQLEEVIAIEENFDREEGYTPPRRLFLGFGYQFTLRDQIGTPMEVYVDNKEQVLAFIKGFGCVLQQGQVVRFECDMLGIHGFIHGRRPEVRDHNGKRIMPGHGDPEFDKLAQAMSLTPEVSEEMRIWREYTAHNPDWYLRKLKLRMRESN